MDNDAATLVTGAHDDRKGFMQQWLDSNESPPVNFAGTCAGERGVDREEGFASCFYSTCLREFQRLCHQEQKGYVHGSRSYLLKEELDKLYMWGESFGPGELDKALEESEELRDSVLDLLVNLGELLICELRASSTVARAGQIHELEFFIKQARLIMSDIDEQVDLDAIASDATYLYRDEYSDNNVHDFCEDVVLVIKCLMELGPSMEQNLASAARSAPSIYKSAFVLFCLSGPAEFYVLLVRDKFKQASRELVERLGEANWQRHLKVRKMFGDTENKPAKGQATARSVFQPDMTFHDSGIGTSVPPSDTSFRTSITEGGSRSLRVPPTPIEAANGESFRCYLCGDMLSTVRTRTQWKMHVFSDLMPYICTFDGCPHKLRCFPSRLAWANHEFQEHRFDRYWACPECPRKSCSTLDWEHHLNDVHSQKFSGPNLVSARNAACRISPKRAEEEECPLCRVALGKPRRAFVRHVSRHMEDIALMALPSSAEEDSERGSISTAPDSDEDNDTSKDLHIDEEDSEIGSISTARAAIKRRVSRRVELSPDAPLMQPNGQHYNVAAEKPTARIMSPYDTTDGLIGESPQVERTPVNAQPSPSPEYLPPPDRFPTPERRERRRRPKSQASQGDAVLIGFMGGLNHSDLASKAGEEPLPQESEESTDEDDEEPTNRESGETMKLARNAVSIVERCDARRDDQHSTSNNEQSESGSDSDQLLPRRMFTLEEKARISAKRKTGACDDCRRAKKKCTHDPTKGTMSHGEHTKPRPSLTSSPVTVNNPLPPGPQMTESTSEAIEKQRDSFNEWLCNEPLDTHLSQDLSSKGIYFHRPEVREPETGVQTEQLPAFGAAKGEAITTLQTARYDEASEASFRRILQRERRERPATSSMEIADPYDHSDDRTISTDHSSTAFEQISGAEEGLSRSNPSAWQLAYGKSLEPAKEEDGGK